MALPVGFNPKRTFRATDSTGKENDFFEVCLFAGAAVIGQSGTGSVTVDYNSTWLAEFRADKTVHVFRQDNGALSWTEITEDLPVFPTFTGNERRFSFAFDQNLRLVYAYELNEVIYMTRFSGGDYVQDISFAGTNPTLLAEALPAQFVADSDVVCFYQKSSDMAKIYNRIQSDNYGVERELVDYGSGIILDKAFYDSNDPLRYGLLISDEFGEKFYIDDDLQGYVSTLYPLRLWLDLASRVDIQRWVNRNTVTIYDLGDDVIKLDSNLSIQEWILNTIVTIYNMNIDLDSSLSIQEWILNTIVTTYNVSIDLDSSLDIQEWILEVIAVQYSPAVNLDSSLAIQSWILEVV